MVDQQERRSDGAQVPVDRDEHSDHSKVLASIPASKHKKYAYWLAEYRQDWKGEVPIRLHLPGSFGLGSAPPFSPEFVGYVGHLECGKERCKECSDEKERQRTRKHYRRDDARYRTTKAFRKLRSVAPREFDAMYMYCMHGQTPSDIARSMNAEMLRKDRPERFTAESIVLLLYSGVDKVMGWW
jgi:hypothetical protein